MSSDVDGRLDGERHTVQRPDFVAAHDCFFRMMRLGEYNLGLPIHESVEFGIELRDAVQMNAGNVNRGDGFRADLRCKASG